MDFSSEHCLALLSIADHSLALLNITEHYSGVATDYPWSSSEVALEKLEISWGVVQSNSGVAWD